MSAYDQITAKIIQAIETGAAKPGAFKMPWHSKSGRPINVASGKAYRGINTLMLWSETQERGYGSPLWGTLKQWNEKGGRVRKGEKASLIVFWKDIPAKDEEEEGSKRFVLKTSYAFNEAQIEGYRKESAPIDDTPDLAAETLCRLAKVDLRLMGDKAFYHPRLDYVQLPPRADFTSHEAFQSVLLHEAAHWTGHQSRLAREYGKKFGDNAYAFEELVAELSSAFLCADLGVSNQPRLDHAHYVSGWLEVLKNDSRAIFSASSAAAKAADFLLDFRNAKKNAA